MSAQKPLKPCCAQRLRSSGKMPSKTGEKGASAALAVELKSPRIAIDKKSRGAFPHSSQPPTPHATAKTPVMDGGCDPTTGVCHRPSSSKEQNAFANVEILRSAKVTSLMDDKGNQVQLDSLPHKPLLLLYLSAVPYTFLSRTNSPSLGVRRVGCSRRSSSSSFLARRICTAFSFHAIARPRLIRTI
jgi:hypothetical protein